MRLRRSWIVLLATAALIDPGFAQQSSPDVQFTTTDRLEGCTISRYLGVVTTAPRIGGDRAPSQKEFPATTQAAMTTLVEQAKALCANGVLKL